MLRGISRLRPHDTSKKQGFCAKTCHQPQRNPERYIKNYILGVFFLNMLISMDRRLIILVPSHFSCQTAFNDTHDDPNEPTLQFHPGHGQCHHITMDFIMCWVAY